MRGQLLKFRDARPQSGRCLDAIGAGFADGTRLWIRDCDSGADQRWTYC